MTTIRVAVSAEEARMLEAYERAPEWGKRRILACARFFARVLRPSDTDELRDALAALFAHSPQWKSLRSITREAWTCIASHRAMKRQLAP